MANRNNGDNRREMGGAGPGPDVEEGSLQGRMFQGPRPELPAWMEGPQYDLGGLDYDPMGSKTKLRRHDDEENSDEDGPPRQSGIPDDGFKEIINWNWAKIKDIERLDAFNTDTIKYLKGLSEFSYNHQEVGYHICYFIEEEVRNDPDGFYPTDAEELKNDLDYLALNEKIAEKAVKYIAGSIMCTQNAAFWATNFVANWILCNQEGPFKYKTCIHDFAFDQRFSNVTGPDGVRNLEKTIEIINVKDMEVSDIDFTDMADDINIQYFYHGTDWASVDSIVQDGIILHGDEFGKDFSFRHRPGFYVYDKFENAKEWAESKAACPAVIVFEVRNNLFSDNSQHLDLCNAGDEFKKKVYAFHRSRGEEEVDVETEIEGFQTIKGPVLLNPKELIAEGEQPRLSNDQQLCILDVNIASQFYSSIRQIVYYEKRDIMTMR